MRFEYRVRDIFRNHGYEAERKAASAPYDIIVMLDGRVVFVVDAKKTSVRRRKYLYVKRGDVEKIMASAASLGARPLIAYGFNMGDVLVAFPEELLKSDGKNFRLEGGLSLETFLRTYVTPFDEPAQKEEDSKNKNGKGEGPHGGIFEEDQGS